MGSVAQKTPQQGDVWWVNLDPTVGKEINKKRPCVVVSPNEANQHIGTCIVAPITRTLLAWPTRHEIKLQKQQSSVALDQIRMIDNSRLIRRITHIDAAPLLGILREMFE